MPTNCFDCKMRMAIGCIGVLQYQNTRMPNCPLIEIPPSRMTNADRIRAMSDEELAEMLNKPIGYACDGNCHIEEDKCVDCFVKWLKKEVEQ